MAVCIQSVYSACPSHASHLTPKAEYKEKKYTRYCQGLSTIPDNIPAEAEVVWIRGNTIRTVPANAFSHLSHCTYLLLSYNEIEWIESGAFNGLISLKWLDLDNNKLSEIEPGTFNGLISLKRLNLRDNKLSEIEPGTFSQLPALIALYLFNNKLTALPWTVFTNGTGNITRPAGLLLELSDNPLQCDTSLCWVKQGEQDGWLTWGWSRHGDPDCSDYAGPTWEVCSIQGKFFNNIMCWVKQGQQDGWLTMVWFGDNPDCASYPDTDWPDVNLLCVSMGKSL